MFHSMMFYVILLAATTRSQTSPPLSAAEVAHYPRLIHADLPLYPPLALTIHVTGTVEIQVVIEKGALVDAQVNSVVLTAWNGPALTDEGKKKVGNYLSDPSLTNIKTWRFDSEGRITFPVKYVYSIEGEPTTVPENPRVELASSPGESNSEAVQTDMQRLWVKSRLTRLPEKWPRPRFNAVLGCLR